MIMTRVAPSLYRYETTKGLRYLVRIQVQGRDIWRRGFLTKEQAQDFLNTFRFKVTEVKRFPDRLLSPILKEYIPEWLNACGLRGLRHTTIRSYRYNLLQHVAPLCGDLPLNKITRQHIVLLLQNKKKDGYSRDALRLMVAPLSRLYGDAADEGLVEPNYNPCLRPGRIIKIRRKKVVKAYAASDVAAILKTAEQVQPDHVDLLAILFGLGVRAGEAIALEAEDLIADHRLSITKTFTDGELHDTPKNGQTRVLEVEPNEWAILTRRATLGRLFRGDGKQGYLNYRSWRRWVWDPIIQEAGVVKLTPHSTRHTYATLHLKAGCSIQWLSYQLGHSSIKVTVDTYGHLQPTAR